MRGRDDIEESGTGISSSSDVLANARSPTRGTSDRQRGVSRRTFRIAITSAIIFAFFIIVQVVAHTHMDSASLRSSMFVSPAGVLSSSKAQLLNLYHRMFDERQQESVEHFIPLLEEYTYPDNASAYVKEAMRHAWQGYSNEAWGHDEVRPIYNGYSDRWGGFALTLIDSLDTLWMMGMKDEFWKARDYVVRMNFKKNVDASFFEMTIRCLGGLLSAYELSEDAIFLTKAEQLGEKLLKAFDKHTGLPWTQVNLNTGERSIPHHRHGKLILAEIGTFQLEFLALARHTGRQEFADVVKRFNDIVLKSGDKNGLYPSKLKTTLTSSGELDFVPSDVTLGALGDSFYEYIVKQYLYTGDERLLRKSSRMMNAIRQKLHFRSKPSNLLYVAELHETEIHGKMDHLSFFYPGFLGLAAAAIASEKESETWLWEAEEILMTCEQIYASSTTGLGPEVTFFNILDRRKSAANFVIKKEEYLLRPEFVESLFILYRLTRLPTIREIAWRVFLAIEAYCRTEIAYAPLKDTNPDPYSEDELSTLTPNTGIVKGLPLLRLERDDSMESFFTAETLKYLYLIFEDSTRYALTDYVFTTEAHPLRIPMANPLPNPESEG